MSILVNKHTRVVVQGITGQAGRFHTRRCKEYGTQIVAGVTPGRGGDSVEGLPVFETVFEAVEKTEADATMVVVPAPFAADAILEAIDAGIRTIVAITEGIPVLDMVRVMETLRSTDAVLIGPNCPGVITPDQCKIGIMPGYVHSPGKIGVMSRSGTLTYEAVWQLTQLGLGQSTCIGLGGDPLVGVSFIDLLERFEADPETEGVLMIGEIGGESEELAAAYIAEHITMPVAAFIAGRSAPPGKRMGHAGAIVSGGRGTAQEKIVALQSAGVVVAESLASVGLAMQEALQQRGGGGASSDVRLSAWNETPIAPNIQDCMKAVEVMALGMAPPVVVDASIPIRDVLQRMQEDQSGCALVQRDDELCGIFTERDVLNQVIGFEGVLDHPIVDVMTSDPVRVHETDPIWKALRIMHHGGFRNVPVVDSHERAVACVRHKDLIHYLVEHFPQQVLNLPPDPENIHKARDGG
jgi:succinyl-CoA synthetase alpha subunit